MVPQGGCDGAADDEAEVEEETEEADTDEDNNAIEDTEEDADEDADENDAEEDTDAWDGLQSDAVAAPAHRRLPKPTMDENIIVLEKKKMLEDRDRFATPRS